MEEGGVSHAYIVFLEFYVSFSYQQGGIHHAHIGLHFREIAGQVRRHGPGRHARFDDFRRRLDIRHDTINAVCFGMEGIVAQLEAYV